LYAGWAVQKGNPWGKDINLVTQRLTDSGIVDGLIRKYIKLRLTPKFNANITQLIRFLSDQREPPEPLKAITLEHLLLPFVILVAGLSFSCAAFIFKCK